NRGNATSGHLVCNMILTLMHLSSFNLRGSPALTQQARGSRTTLRQHIEPVDRSIQLQNREEEIGRRSAIIAFCYRFKQMQTWFAQTDASIKAASALTARKAHPVV